MPSLSASKAWIGETFVLDVPITPLDLPYLIAGLSNVVSVLGPLPLSIPALPGCSLYVDPAFIVPLANVGGTATWSLALPNAAALVGYTFYVQGYAVSMVGHTFTDGAEVVIGAK